MIYYYRIMGIAKKITTPNNNNKPQENKNLKTPRLEGYIK